ncbi:HNH endonuclease, partial [Nocardiaceae bacterium NPDC056970]
MNPGGLNNSGIAATALQPDDVRLLTEIALLQNTIDVTREIERLEALRVAMVAEIDERAVSFDT